MIKSHYKETTIEVEVVDEIICNCCGQGIYKSGKDYLEVKKSWGYFSDYDNEHHKFHICHDCYKKWINTFKIQPENISNNL